MLKCLDNDEQTFKLGYKDPIDKTHNLICPDCREAVLFVDSKFKVKHFRHKVESKCNPEPETMAHMIMKSFVLENFGLEKENLEVSLGFARPDLYYEIDDIKSKTEPKNKFKIAVEVQQSKIPYDDFIRRTQNYSDNGIYVLWIFHESLLNPEKISEVIKKAHELYFGRIYLFKHSFFEGIGEGIYPVHLMKYQKYIEDFYNNGISGGGYYKTYKKKRKILTGERIERFSVIPVINNFKDNNFRIARFFDKQFWKDGKD